MLMPAYERMRTLVGRNRRARRLGFTFGRAATFALPPAINIAGKPVSLHLPADNGTRTAFVDIFLDDCYAAAALPDDVRTIADIGSHVGLFALLARARWPHAVIHAYEPNPALKAYWSKHAADAAFEVYEEAVGATAGRAELIAGCDSVHTRTAASASGAVSQVALADVLKRLGGRADLVKLDCEGAEWELLQDRDSWRNVRGLTMEFHLWAGYTLGDLCARLNDLGFTIRRLSHRQADFGLLVASR